MDIHSRARPTIASLLILIALLLEELTYLFGHYNMLKILDSANLRRHTLRAVVAWRQFRIASVVTFSFTC